MNPATFLAPPALTIDEVVAERDALAQQNLTLIRELRASQGEREILERLIGSKVAPAFPLVRAKLQRRLTQLLGDQVTPSDAPAHRSREEDR